MEQPERRCRGCPLVQATRNHGSHHHFKHPEKPGLLKVPPPKKGWPIGTARSVLRTAGLK
ncbi:type II toxin-antitoxin system HicA family toxin [Burkholderia plantarii]|nr:type II toxin-antitoxin system HicA family toxin [Burkholderia plantarii]